MQTIRVQNTNILKCVAFILIVFPFISHIYGAVFPILYDFKISYISSVIIIFTAIIFIVERRIVLPKDIIYFVPFLLVSLANYIYNYDLSFVKYFAYITIYFYFLRRFFLQDFIFKLYVNILVITFLLLMIIYILTINFEVYLHNPWRVIQLEHLSHNAPMYSQCMGLSALPSGINNIVPSVSACEKSQIFYLLVYNDADYSGIFNIPRFYGFSREPGMYIMFILPGFLMAYFFKMKYQAFILGFAIFITASVAGYLVASLLLFIAILPKMQFKNIFYILFVLLALLIIFRYNISELVNIKFSHSSTTSNRFHDYILLFDNLFYNHYLSSLTGDRVFTSSTGVQVSGTLFILSRLSFLLILYHFYRKIKIINIRLVLLFFISFVVLMSRSNEILSPLFLFYLSFIDYIYIAKIRGQRKLLEFI